MRQRQGGAEREPGRALSYADMR